MPLPDTVPLDLRIEELRLKQLILKEQLRSLSEELRVAERELATLEAARKQFVNDGRVDSPSLFDATTRATEMVKRVVRTPASGSQVQEGSIKEAALQALANARDGLIAIDILGEINQHREPPILRTSLSPQLSRLRQAGLVNLTGSVWRITSAGREALAALPSSMT